MSKIDREIYSALLRKANIDSSRYEMDSYYGADENDAISKDILRKKYLDDDEDGPLDVWARCAWANAQAEKEEDRMERAVSFLGILKDFKFLPGGRINYGLGRDDIKVSFSNCYVLPIVDDSLDDIYTCLLNEAKTYKAGGGCGHDLSGLRPKGAPIKGTGGFSCGPVGFMDLFSTSTNTVRQNNRRGANMQTMDVSHPDIEDFITCKNDVKDVKEKLLKIAKFLPKHRMITSFIDKHIESKRKIQHSNISVKLTDKFMKAVADDGDFSLEWNGTVHKTIKAKNLWNLIVENAWESAEPGLIFWDRMVETNNLQYANPLVSTNPCIAGGTLIAVADGRNAVSIEQLAAEAKDVPVYSTDVKTGLVEIKQGRNPRKTGTNKEVWKLVLDDGSVFVATPDHKVLCRNLEYKPLKRLQPGDSVFPFHPSENHKAASVGFHGYEDVYNISVDDNENYHVITSLVASRDGLCLKTGMCVKNCSELPLGAYGNCLLGHMNLSCFVKNGGFDFDDFSRSVRIAVRFLDNIIDLNDGRHPLKEQNEVAMNERRIGLGMTGLGDALIMMGLRYGSEEAMDVVESISMTLRDTAYDASCDLAEEKGSFPWFDKTGFFKSRFAKNLPERIRERIMLKGIRNGMLLTCAPVGTGSIIARTSSGIEPVFRIFYTRMVKEDDGMSQKEYKIYHPLIKQLFLDKGLDIPDYVVDSSKISSENRIKTQAVIQKYIDNSISSTVNLPKSATKEDVANIYMMAWKSGCKGVTVYREGSRGGILLSEEEYSMDSGTDEWDSGVSFKRPHKLRGETFKIRTDTGNGPVNCYFTVNFAEGSNRPYELFIHEPSDNKDMKDILMLELATRTTSMMLRHGIPIEFIVEQFAKIKNQYIFSIPLNISKVLSNYVKNGNGHDKCPECGSANYKHDAGCAVCPDCGHDKCG